jgi:predicted glycosyltransferase
VLILNDFKSFEPEVLILIDFKSLFPEVLILVDLKPCLISEIQAIENFLEVLILRDLRDAMCTNGWNWESETSRDG